MTEIKVQAFVWDEREEPREIYWSGNIERLILQHLETKEYGKIVKIYPAEIMLPPVQRELVLYYRAFDDEHRGRQVATGTDPADLDAAYQELKRRCAMRVFSPAELYAMKPVRTNCGFWHTVSVHLSGEVNYFGIDLDAVEKTQRMETRTLADHDYDGRRGWTLQTVWFDGKPVMVVNSSGRDGDEYHERWITDAGQFGRLVVFLKSFTSEPGGSTDFVKADAKIPAMTEFYSHTIHDYYDVEAQEPKKA
jgi:hypothetical protein